VRAYAANTHQGLVWNYNEDWVSIILNIVKPKNRTNEDWPKCSFFGIYDGHGGSKCAEFLWDYLHQFVIWDENFPKDPKQALWNGFATAEKKFLEFCYLGEGKDLWDKSGSCALVVLIVGNQCYIANVGDSRAILSSNKGTEIYTLSWDHKPTDEFEKQRVILNGGQIYHWTAITPSDTENPDIVVGPLWVLPGRLSVCRTFGDYEAKLTDRGGNPKVVIAVPEVKSFEIKDEHDFVLIGCDGIFDRMNNVDTINAVWKSAQENNFDTIHSYASVGIDTVMKNSLYWKT